MINKIEELINRKRKLAVFPIVCADHCANLLNIKFKRIATDGKKLARALEYCYNLYKYDMVLIFSDPYVEAEAMGCKIEYSPYPKLISNVELRGDGFIKGSRLNSFTTFDRTEVIINAAKILKKNLDVPVFVSIKGPFTLACFLYGTEDFLKILLNNDQVADSVIKMALDFQMQYLERLLKIPVNIFIGDPLASASVISPFLFKKFALKPLKILVEKIKEVRMFCGIHICGDTKPIIKFLDGLNADILSIEDISLKTKSIKMGGVSTITLLNGTAEEIKKEIKKTLQSEYLILSSSCDIPVNTPIKNIKLMVDALNIYDNYRNGCPKV